MSTIRRYAAALFASLAFALPASATTFSTDYTDLWYNPAESGWGINLIQQGNTIFATLFVYGPDNTARWYVASGLVGNTQTSFSGTLYRTTGPWFGAAWNGSTTLATVGNLALNFNTPSTATLQYSVDGVTVTKSIQRQLFIANNLAGNYLGGLVARSTSCASGNATDILVFNVFAMTHSASNAVSMPVQFFTANGQPASCTFNGTYSQAGKLGSIAGNWSCTTGNTGAYTITEIDTSRTGWSGKFNGNDQFCSYSGNFGGVRDVF
jgi:hypothetical protein